MSLMLFGFWSNFTHSSGHFNVFCVSCPLPTVPLSVCLSVFHLYFPLSVSVCLGEMCVHFEDSSNM